ncbi:MAG: N-acetyltransferase family protein [Solirubrobacteraceae bacterium]
MGSVLIRRARSADLDDLLSLYQELADTRNTAAPTDRASSEPLLAEILADRTRQLVVAVLDGRLVGTADLLVVPNLTHHGKPWAIVENVIVARAVRRTGVGTQLIGRLIELARVAGCYKLQLQSGKQRAEAHEFYRDLGLAAVAEGFKIYFDE